MPSSWLKLRPQGGKVTIIIIRSGKDISIMLIELSILPGVLPLTPVLITCHILLGFHVLPTAIYFVTGVRSICGVNLISSIPRFVGGGQYMDGLETQ